MPLNNPLTFPVESALTSSSPTAGIGYAIGAGGTVTQATSKTTAVTLNKVCGTITMNNAALAAGASVVFVLNNSSIASTDFVSVLISGGIALEGTYDISVHGVFGGVCALVLKNISAGSLSEAVQVRFKVDKAVNA